jgi:hypothetical protein
MLLTLVDAAIFLIAVVFFILAAFIFRSKSITQHGFSEWQFSADLYWGRTIYGLLSFPFILFKIPGLSLILTHAKPTGYLLRMHVSS